MRSRLGWGLVADIHPTTYELRLGILQTKAEQPACRCRRKVLEFLAHKITSNVRELEGALNRIVAHATLVGRDDHLETAQEVLHDLLRANDRRVTIEEIQKRVAEHFNIKLADMHSPRRARAVARPRQVAMYLAKQLTTRVLPEIGRKFGGRDHTTVMHAVRKIEELLRRRLPHSRGRRAAASACCRADASRRAIERGPIRGPVSASAEFAGSAALKIPAKSLSKQPALCYTRRRSDMAIRAGRNRRPSKPLIFGAARNGERQIHETDDRTGRAAEGPGPCAERGRAPQHHPDPVERPARGARATAEPDRDRHGSRHRRDGRRPTSRKAGATTAPAHTLYDIVRKLPEARRSSSSASGRQRPDSCCAPAARASRLAVPAGRGFPGDDRGRPAAPLPARRPPSCTRLIDRTRFAISTEETRYYLNGIYLHAADSRRHAACCARSRPTATAWRASRCRCPRAPRACPA